MLEFLARLVRREKVPPVNPDAGRAGSIMGDLGDALGDSAESYSGEIQRSVEVPLAPREASVSYSALEKEPLAPRNVAPEPETEPTPRRSNPPSKQPPVSDSKGWDLLKEDTW